MDTLMETLPDLAVSIDTLAVHAGREDLPDLGVHVPPIDLSSTNPLPSVDAGGESYEVMAGGGHPGPGGPVYQRLWNPTVARFETALAALEGTAESVAFASGMAAFTACVLAARQVGAVQGRGSHVVAIRPLYGGTDHVLASGLLGTDTTFVPAELVADAVRADTCLVVLETPGNPTLDLVDVAAVVHAAGDVPVLVDNTFATPVLQNPAALGASMVLHSGTKYLGGHGDVLAGAVACDLEWAAALRRVRALTGAIVHPLSGYLLHRGLQTLPLRVRAQQDSARQLAAWLAHEAPHVAQVHYPGLPGGDPYGVIGTQMRGPGAMIAIRLAGGAEVGFRRATEVTQRCHLFTHAVSLGGVDSLIQHPAALTHRPVAPGARPSPDIVRLSIGLEDIDDLRADLEQALR
ncbi:L-methionine gamma-lyase [Austwickia sp. TVS 96-490-7B]|uniref:trans-sulfuration enzyme family protein n=1 Tax=Austwickia sp. TVS 96-490-7B TaxID=2830843 RepID=UPI001DF8EBF5|nr:PLP-dependent aspartate aminotransferase family protein [Austwickia sp. TVS 96-490-7B]MBW3085309.1 L-methionine gamma-lyase [Austwickia sp. TVS 96-490-7B]